MSSARVRRAMAIGAIVAAVAYFAYGLVDGHLIGGPTVYIRNETGRWVYLSVLGNGIDDEDTVSVHGWSEGTCATTVWTWHHPNTPEFVGNGTSVMESDSGGSYTTVKFEAGQPLYVRIDADGGVHTGEPVPADTPGCTPAKVKDGWEWSADDP